MGCTVGARDRALASGEPSVNAAKAEAVHRWRLGRTTSARASCTGLGTHPSAISVVAAKYDPLAGELNEPHGDVLIACQAVLSATGAGRPSLCAVHAC